MCVCYRADKESENTCRTGTKGGTKRPQAVAIETHLASINCKFIARKWPTNWRFPWLSISRFRSRCCQPQDRTRFGSPCPASQAVTFITLNTRLLVPPHHPCYPLPCAMCKFMTRSLITAECEEGVRGGLNGDSRRHCGQL